MGQHQVFDFTSTHHLEQNNLLPTDLLSGTEDILSWLRITHSATLFGTNECHNAHRCFSPYWMSYLNSFIPKIYTTCLPVAVLACMAVDNVDTVLILPENWRRIPFYAYMKMYTNLGFVVAYVVRRKFLRVYWFPSANISNKISSLMKFWVFQKTTFEGIDEHTDSKIPNMYLSNLLYHRARG